MRRTGFFCVWGLVALLALPVWAEEDEALDANGFPASWQAKDFDFTMLEPAAGAAVEVPSPTAPAAPSLSAAAGLAQTITPTVPAKSYRITELPRVSLTPSGTMALPAAAGEGLANGAEGSVFRPIGQVLPQQRSQGVAADLGIVVSEQSLAGRAGGAEALAAYGPLAAGVAAPEKVWQGADAATQRTRLQEATEKPLQSMALREAYRMLLLAQVQAPVAGATQPNWLAVRAETLEDLGWYEAAWSLWREAGPLLRQPATPPELLQGWARMSLLAGQTEAACSLVREQAAAGMVSDFWPSASAVCAALDLQSTGNPAPLALAIQLLPPRTLQTEPALLGALTAVRDAVSPTLGQKAGKAWPITPLAGAVLAAAPELLPPEVLPHMPDVALRRIRESTELPGGTRTLAALYLASKTGWPDDAKAWLALASSPTVPLTLTPNWPDAVVVAWAHVVSGTAANTPEISAEVSGTEPQASHLKAAAPKVVAAALRMGDAALAQAWWPLWAQGVSGTLTRPALQVKILKEMALKQDIQPTLQSWLRLPEVSAAASQRVLAVLEGMGHDVPDTAWAKVAATAGATDALNLAWQRLLENAAQKQDKPAVLAMVAEALRGQNAASASPAVLRASLQALRMVGAQPTALRLAAEALTLTPTAAATAARAMPMAEEADTETRVMTIDGPAKPAAPKVASPTLPKVKVPLLPKPKV